MINVGSYRLKDFEIKNFRSIGNLLLEIPTNDLLVICGANNVGKTNFLRAMDLFFSLDPKKFNAYDDIPYSIAEGSRGGGYKTTLIGNFISNDGLKPICIKVNFSNLKGKSPIEIKAKRGQLKMYDATVRNFISQFRFIFIESSNIDITEKIARIINDDVLLGVEKKKRNKATLVHLKDFIEESQKKLKEIQDEITDTIKSNVKDIKGVDSSRWKAEILFPEFNNLRDAISQLISFTLNDSNNRQIRTKGSGIQRIILFSLIEYISNKSDKKTIWGLDEPEAFLQPGLQKQFHKKLLELGKNIPILITTHSHNFIDLSDIKNTYLFEASAPELKLYQRRPNQSFYKTNTIINNSIGVEKINLIKNQLGIEKGDDWSILPYNLLVEGEDDRDYLSCLIKFYKLELPNIFIAEGADKMKNYLSFLNNYSAPVKGYRPKVLCLLDHDDKGIEVYKALENLITTKYQNLEVKLKYVPRFDGDKPQDYRYEMEDLMPNAIMIDIVNDISEKTGYNKMTATEEQKRTGKAYDQKEILEFLNETVKSLNHEQEELHLLDPGRKKLICKIACDMIRDGKYADLLNKSNNIKDFINSIADERYHFK